MDPKLVLDRIEACKALGISRQTLISWIRKGKIKVWKRVGRGSNAALLFERKTINAILTSTESITQGVTKISGTENFLGQSESAS